jgi:hypothetical protein
MATLTVYFKNEVVRSYPLEMDKMIRIGCDETNDLVIDSFMLAPVHAVVVTRGNSCVIKQLNDNFPLIINGKSIKAANLHDGDTLTMGQHDIIYSTSQSEQLTDSPSNRKIAKNGYIPHVANFQVISGAHLGKIFPLKIPMTMIGEQGSGIVAVTKRKNGYFAAVLEHTDTITLNQQPLGNQTIQLNHRDVMVVGQLTVQFYLQ